MRNTAHCLWNIGSCRGNRCPCAETAWIFGGTWELNTSKGEKPGHGPRR